MNCRHEPTDRLCRFTEQRSRVMILALVEAMRT